MAVELFDPSHKYAAPDGAQLTFRGGPILKSVKLFGVFFDSFPYKTEMSSYLDWFATSDVLVELAEYNTGLGSHIGDAQLSLGGSTPPPTPPPPVPGPPLPPPPPVQCPPGCVAEGHKHHRHRIGRLFSLLKTKHLSSDAGSQIIQDSDLQKIISNAIGAGSLPKPDGETLFVLFLPDGVTVQMGSDASCTTFCGYHDTFSLSDGSAVYYAVLPFPSCDGCLGGLQEFDALTATTSHEISEAVTDPVPGSGWYDDANGEVGDICAWQFRSDSNGQLPAGVSSYNVQLEWSNQKNRCI
jgi:hypothetical protein